MIVVTHLILTSFSQNCVNSGPTLLCTKLFFSMVVVRPRSLILDSASPTQSRNFLYLMSLSLPNSQGPSLPTMACASLADPPLFSLFL